MAAQKVTPQVNPAAKNVNVQPIPGPASKSPKVPRGARLPPQPRGGTKGPPIPTLEVPVVAPPAPGNPGPPPRRPRPVIGLPSRHFEAALSGAGVGAQGDRKPRRERENVKEKDAATLPPPVTSSGTVPTESAQIHLSPRRDRGGRKEVSPAYTSGAGAMGGRVGPLDPPKVPGILQRTDGPPAPAVGMPRIDNDGGVGPPAQDPGAPSFRGGRGGRRGRGRGRGTRGG
jgi:regulator of nonsense transcripts 3